MSSPSSRSPSRPRRGGSRAASGIATSISTTARRSREVAQAHTPITMQLDAVACTSPSTKRRWSTTRRMWLRRVDGPAPEGGAVAVVERAEGRAQRAVRRRRGARCRSRPTRRRPVHVAISSSISTSRTSSATCRGSSRSSTSASGGACTWARRPGRPGPKHGATTAEHAALHRLRREAMAFAACWSKAGTRAGMATGSRTAMTFSFTEPYPDFDLEALAAYAKKKGVHLIGHHETAGNIAHYEQQLGAGARSVPEARHRRGQDRLCRRCRRHPGAGRGRHASISNGTTARCMSRHHLQVVTEAAKRHIAVNRARAHQGHGPAAHVSELGLARRRARHGIQRLGRSAESARARGEPRVHAHARRARWISRPAC